MPLIQYGLVSIAMTAGSESGILTVNLYPNFALQTLWLHSEPCESCVSVHFFVCLSEKKKLSAEGMTVLADMTYNKQINV